MQLDSIQRKLEQLLEPREERGFFVRLWGTRQEPVEVQSDALGALMKQLAPSASTEHVPTRGAALRPYFDAASRELSANIDAVRELSEARSHPPFAYVTWLWKVSQVLSTLESDGWLDHQTAYAQAKRSEPLPPSWLLRLPPEPLLPPLRTGPRLQGLALGPLLDLASRERHHLGRRRRLLEAARRVLLETSASVAQPPAAVQARLVSITGQIRQINQWQAAGLEPEVDVAHQLRSAVKRRDAKATGMLLQTLHELTRGSPQPLPQAKRLVAARQAARKHLGRAAEPPSLESLRRDTFGDTAASAVQRGSERAVTENDAPPGGEFELVRAASAVDGAFELGRSVAPVRVLEEQRRMAVVDFPTQTLVLAPARRVSDLSSAIVGDPRLLLHDFASRSLLARRYLGERRQRRTVPERYSEARFYLLDGSASMSGRRARMRDATLIAELSTMIRHLEQGNARARPVVYYRYFSKGSEPLVKASTIEEACACIEAILLRKSRGETDIEGALLESFDELRQARERDDGLKRAQLVLITDGVAKLDLDRVWAARQSVGDIPVLVSVIALGSENPALKQLAAFQRARGQPVFYHYLSDETLFLMARGAQVRRPTLVGMGETGPGARVELPPRRPEPAAAAEPAPDGQEAVAEVSTAPDEEVWRELDQLVDELSLLREPPDLDGVEQAAHLDEAYSELGLSLEHVGFEAERAKFEALQRNRRALCVRFDRWFPDPAELAGPGPLPMSTELPELIEIVLSSVTELVAYLHGSPLQRRVDAIELLERLLVEAGVAPWTYTRALRFATPAARNALRELRGLVGSGAEAD